MARVFFSNTRSRLFKIALSIFFQEICQAVQSPLVRVVGPVDQEDGMEPGRGREVAPLGQADANPVEDHRSHRGQDGGTVPREVRIEPF